MEQRRRMQSSMAILQIRNLSVHRGRVRILRSIHWTVKEGQHWVILGANGSGKTSMLKALTGYLMPSAGTIELLGRRYGEFDWREQQPGHLR